MVDSVFEHLRCQFRKRLEWRLFLPLNIGHVLTIVGDQGFTWFDAVFVEFVPIFARQMPLADEPGAVAFFLEGFCIKIFFVLVQINSKVSLGRWFVLIIARYFTLFE